jgi:hypothetical protein
MSNFLRYYRTPRGVLLYRYRDMRDRVRGKPLRTGMEKTPQNCPWKGMELAPYQEFLSWALAHPDFQRLFKQWADNGFVRRFAPTVHRIDRSRGYTLDNIEWITHRANSRIALGHDPV